MGQFKLCTSEEAKVAWDATGVRLLSREGRQVLELRLAAFLKALLFCEDLGSCSIFCIEKTWYNSF